MQVRDGPELNHLARYFVHQTFTPGTVVSRMGDADRKLYLIASGSATVYVTRSAVLQADADAVDDEDGGAAAAAAAAADAADADAAANETETELAVLTPGMYFGEISLVREGTVRSASIRAGDDALTVLVLESDMWQQLDGERWFRGVNQRLRLTANHRFAAKLKTIPFLAKVPASSLDVLGGLFRLQTCSAGDVVMEEGDAAKGFFVMCDGAVRVSTSNEDGTMNDLHTITKDSRAPYFGELSLLEKVQVTATITAESDCLLLFLPPDSFTTFLGIVPGSVKGNLRKTIRKRAKRALGSMVADVIDPQHVGTGIELDHDSEEEEEEGEGGEGSSEYGYVTGE